MTDRKALAASLLQREVRPKPAADQMSPPVAWLLGPEMIGALKSFLQYAAYKGEFDPHDWMQGEAVTYEPPADGAFWFDFVSDIGDGQLAMYTTALLLQDDLYIDDDELPDRMNNRVNAVALPAVVGACPPGSSVLPRGRFLMVGGDTAYPLADQVNLQEHVRLPFTWALRDLVAAGRVTDDTGVPHQQVDLYGIPGNHDYYDQLTGFNRVFRAPLTGEGEPGSDGRLPPLSLLGYRRRQTASYVALRLPWDWQLWGIDPGTHGVDYRQDWFFAHEPTPDKLILVTPSPPIAFGRVIVERSVLAWQARRGVAAPYLAPANAPTILLDGKPADDSARGPDGAVVRALAPHQCRVDLAGDMHYYARYGTDPAYAAVVSGAGGAFHHPSYNDFGEVPPQSIYPSPRQSRRAIADALFHPRTVFHGGVFNVLAFAVALVTCAASILPGTRALTDPLLSLLGVTGERVWGTSEVQAGWHTQPWADLRGAALVTGSLVIAGGLILLALGYARWVSRTLRLPRDEWPRAMRILRAMPFDRVLEERGYLPSWILVIIAAALPALVGQLVALPSAALLLFQLLFFSLVVGIGVAVVLLAVGAGGEFARPAERLPYWFIGAWHAVIQLTSPLVIVRIGLASPFALAATMVGWLALALLSREALTREGKGYRNLVVALWAVHYPLLLAIVTGLGDGTAILPGSTWGWVGLLALAGAIGSGTACIEYGWYLAATSALGGHNNEAGAAARIERFRQFVRFRLEPDRLTGFVIAVDEPGASPAEVHARLVDVFSIRPTSPRRPTAPPAP
ncbi:MAG: hypothetical protein K8W52_06865 [Deltaproteobacteria bacterium]|nr:hypothetical protein [Deltaproteobacteria bacterium]